jgi:hypothetical protein
VKHRCEQHHELDRLFDDFERASEGSKKMKLQLSRKISDLLAPDRQHRDSHGDPTSTMTPAVRAKSGLHPGSVDGATRMPPVCVFASSSASGGRTRADHLAWAHGTAAQNRFRRQLWRTAAPNDEATSSVGASMATLRRSGCTAGR